MVSRTQTLTIYFYFLNIATWWLWLQKQTRVGNKHTSSLHKRGSVSWAGLSGRQQEGRGFGALWLYESICHLSLVFSFDSLCFGATQRPSLAPAASAYVRVICWAYLFGARGDQVYVSLWKQSVVFALLMFSLLWPQSCVSAEIIIVFGERSSVFS